MATTRTKIITQAQSWIGCKESNGTHKKIIDTYNAHKPLARSYKVKYTDAWCATFVSACAIKCGATDIIPTECSCSKMITLFKNLGSWKETDSYTPQAGDIIFYDWDDSGKGENTGNPEHVGIVEKVSGNNITVIEGNYSNSVKRRTLKVNGRYIRGYGLPKYEEEKPAAPTFALGDRVKLTKDATIYGQTKKFSVWVYLTKLYVREIKNDRIVVSTKKSGAVTGAVAAKHLKKV